MMETVCESAVLCTRVKGKLCVQLRAVTSDLPYLPCWAV